MYKKITPLLYCVIFIYSLQVTRANTYKTTSTDSISTHRSDTVKASEYRIINKNFNAAYLQNLMPSFAGQEFFDKNKTLLVADLSANFVIINTPKVPFFFVASARVNLRLFDSQGDPVKSSYMPGGTLYFRLNRDYYRPEFLSISYTHHSNGTEGPTLNPNGTFNTDSGKFTTNFYSIAWHTGKRTDNGDIIINRYDAIGVDLHASLVGLGYSHQLQGKYGFVRVNGQWIYNVSRAWNDVIDDKKTFQNWQRIAFDFQYIADKVYNYGSFDLKKRLNVNLKYYYQFPFMQNTALVIGGGYRGQDELNIFFNDSYAYATIGLSAGLSFNKGNGK